ncbi:MAG: hypothetical protein OXT67_11710, partial [Zetaproteobacteria bacterium]|nr:hypothetical protein [Zetaproteobacteria bacterium]
WSGLWAKTRLPSCVTKPKSPCSKKYPNFIYPCLHSVLCACKYFPLVVSDMFMHRLCLFIDRYDKQIERCDKKEGAVERDAFREKAEQERGSDKQDCAKDTDRCYQAEKETASAANTSETKNAGDAMRDSLGERKLR